MTLSLSHSLLATLLSYLPYILTRYTPDLAPLQMLPLPRLIFSQVSKSATSLSPGLQRWHLYRDALLYHSSMTFPKFLFFSIAYITAWHAPYLFVYLYSVLHPLYPRRNFINKYIIYCILYMRTVQYKFMFTVWHDKMSLLNSIFFLIHILV